MSPEEMVLDPWSMVTDHQEELPQRPIGVPAREPEPEPGPAQAVPPVRTIVLDREPSPVRPHARARRLCAGPPRAPDRNA